MNSEMTEQKTIFGNETAKYGIVVSRKSTVAEYRTAKKLCALIKRVCNVDLPVLTDEAPAGGFEIVVGKTNRGTVRTSEFDCVAARKGNSLFLRAGSLYGYQFLLEEFERSVLPRLTPDAPSILFKKDVRSDLVKAGLASRAAKTTDLRLITHNIWGWHNAGDPNVNHREVLREHQLGELYLEYQPDIICLQECCESEGIGTSAAMRNEKKDLYVTDVLPKCFTETTRRQDGKNYTATPILYNRKALKLRSSGTKQFTGNGAGYDKYYTWGIFERKGKTFGVMSVHLDYQGIRKDGSAGDGWTNRKAQIDVVTAKIHELSAKHGNCPFFVAGDMNCCAMYEADTLQKWTDNGLYDTHDLAYCSKNTSSYQQGGPFWDAELDILKAGPLDPRGYAASIDHIYYYPVEGTAANLRNYDIIGDEFAFCGSDHAAVMLDFEF